MFEERYLFNSNKIKKTETIHANIKNSIMYLFLKIEL